MVNRKNFFRRRSTSSIGGGGGADGEYPTRKLVIVGDGTCGKTSLLFAFTRDEFYEAYVPTIFETSIVDMEIRPGKVIALSLWDTAGQEAYARLRPLSYTDTHVILICFAMDSRDSFNNVRDTWYPEVRHYCPRAALLLVGCKNDLASSAADCVTRDEVEKLADNIGATSHFLCSAKTRENVTEVFETAADVAYEAGRKKSKISSRLGACFGRRSRKKTEKA
ncbi:hypothetical protein BOX15_Mlig027552g1 [Macrostomum lignano]|uniref:Uncharacterized protein n=1 Tax=Macrostomum lignano TaxID=282301 RepID=A0A267GXC4_9PLAT|nr:hypothetical protein BOX15_Mlig027552g1 [Macrostomum lignano]